MGNWICFDDTLEPSFKMSNGLTDVFIDYMLLAGSELAQTESERRLIAFLSEKQQSVIGIGTVGFHLVEMPWDKASFEADKAFLLRAIARARELTAEESVWDMLRYKPNPENIEYALDGFKELAEHMTVADIVEDNLREWVSDSCRKPDDPVLNGCTKCPKHGLIMSFFGCKLCNELK